MFNCSYGLSVGEDSDYGRLMCKTKGTSVGKIFQDITVETPSWYVGKW